MPEGDTVFQVARRLDEALGRGVLDIVDLRVPHWANAGLAGSRHEGTIARGKHLLTRLQAPDAVEWTLHTHLGMDGIVQILPPGGRWRRAGHRARVVLGTSAKLAVCFDLSVVELLARKDEHTATDHLGPDLLGPDWDAAEALRRLTDDPDRPVWEALLDQSVMAGVGNVFANELCFVAGLHPSTPVGRAPRPERLVHNAHRMLELNRLARRRTTTGDTRPGRELWVYGRWREACRRCGTPIRREERGQESHVGSAPRPTYWCPRCQPERAPER